MVFCDDSDIAGQPVAHLVPDLRLIVAIEMRSELYIRAAERVAERLAELGMSKFHATEIANPPSGSEWSAVATKDRISALSFLMEVLASCDARAMHVRVSKGQYAHIRAAAKEFGDVSVGLKVGLKRVLVRSLVQRLSNGLRPAALVLDRDRSGDAPVVEEWPGAAFLVCGGPIVAPSERICGLQLADLAAWSINRMLVRRGRFNEGTANGFDEVALRVVAGMGTIGDLLQEAL